MVKVIGAELAPLITSAFPPVAVVEEKHEHLEHVEHKDRTHREPVAVVKK